MSQLPMMNLQDSLLWLEYAEVIAARHQRHTKPETGRLAEHATRRCAFAGCDRPIHSGGSINVYLVPDTRRPQHVVEEHWCLACAQLYFTGPSQLYAGRSANDLDSCRAPLK